MVRMDLMCKKCAGLGYTNERYIPNDDGITCKTERDTCDECNGVGHTEYAIFSIEEANAILKHCGLSTEN